MVKREKPSLLRKLGRKFENIAFRGSWARGISRALHLQQLPGLRTLSVDVGLAARGRSPIRVAFVSDLHSGRMTHPELIKEAGRILAATDCDILLIGGDYIFLSAEELGLVLEAFKPVMARLGKYGVLGNHDRWITGGELPGKMAEAGVRMLVNEKATISGDLGRLSIYGLDDVEWGDPSFAEAGAREPEEIRILLAHSPEALSFKECAGFDFAFFGHTHAGQVAPPVGKPVLPFKDRFSRMFPYGLYEKGEEDGLPPFYVTSGVGCVWLPFRIFARPEVVLITFV